MIQQVLRSTFLISNGNTSAWSVEITSHPRSAIPEEYIILLQPNKTDTKILMIVMNVKLV